MRVLALDTTTRAGSVAVVDGDRIVAERRGDASRSHAERLPGDILALLESCAIALPAIDLFAVAAGPGSFTGLRIGIATMQGLAFVHGRRIGAVSALDALAHSAAKGLPVGATVAAWMDAFRHEVFSALYRVAATDGVLHERLIELEPASVGSPEATMARWASLGAPRLFAGDGAAVYRDAIGAAAAVVDAPPLAGIIGRLAAGRAAAGSALDPAAVQPLYVRRPDAEVARDGRAAAIGGEA